MSTTCGFHKSNKPSKNDLLQSLSQNPLGFRGSYLLMVICYGPSLLCVDKKGSSRICVLSGTAYTPRISELEARSEWGGLSCRIMIPAVDSLRASFAVKSFPETHRGFTVWKMDGREKAQKAQKLTTNAALLGCAFLEVVYVQRMAMPTHGSGARTGSMLIERECEERKTGGSNGWAGRFPTANKAFYE